MFQSRDEIRQVYLDVWHKMQRRQPLQAMESVIAEVIEAHSEYHPLLMQADDLKQREFTPEEGQTNPFLHLGMHIALREQAAIDRPAGIQAIYRKLLRSKGQHNAEHAMMECLGEALWKAQRNRQTLDEKGYFECLKNL